MATMLTYNAKGPMVLALQQALNAKFLPVGKKIITNGWFGRYTQGAVLAYNESIGFRNKPYADDATLSALGVTPSAFKTPENAPAWNYTFGENRAASNVKSWGEIWASAPGKIRTMTAEPPIGVEEPTASSYTGAALLGGVPVLAIGALALAGVAWWMWNR